MGDDLHALFAAEPEVGSTVPAPAVYRDIHAAFAAEPEAPGLGEAVLRGGAQGATMGFADELAGQGAGMQQTLKDWPELAGVPDAELYATAAPSAAGTDAAIAARDKWRDADAAARKAHPIAFGASGVAGGIVPTLAIPGGAFATVPRAVATGAALGALGGAGTSEAEDLAGVGEDALKGAGVGAVAAPLALGVQGAAGAVAGKLKDLSIAAGRRVLSGGAHSISVKAPVAAEAVEEAFQRGVIKPFGTTRGAAERLEGLRSQFGDQYARILQALEGKGITGPEADALAQQYAAEAVAAEARSMNAAVPKVYESAADQLGGKPTVQGRLSLSRAEDLKQSLQDQASAAYKQLQPNEVAQAREAAAGMMRKSVEDEIAQQAAASGDPVTEAIAAQFKPTKETLGRVIEASNVARKGVAQEAQRRMISPSDYAAGAAGVLAGGPGGVIAGVANHLLRTRGTSAVAVGARHASRLMRITAENPGKLGRYAAILVPALHESKERFNAESFVLGQTQPDFQQKLREINETETEETE